MARSLRKPSPKPRTDTDTDTAIAELDALLLYACHAIARRRAKWEPEAALWVEVDELLDARVRLMDMIVCAGYED